MNCICKLDSNRSISASWHLLKTPVIFKSQRKCHTWLWSTLEMVNNHSAFNLATFSNMSFQHLQKAHLIRLSNTFEQKAFLVWNALKWPISYPNRILITKGKIFSSHWLLRYPSTAAAILKTCISTVVRQSSVNIFLWPKCQSAFLSRKAFSPSRQTHNCNRWQTGLSTSKFHQLRASELHWGSVHSDSNVYCCFYSLTFYLSWWLWL